MKVNIRKGDKKDLPIVLNLIKDLAKYEDALENVTLSVSQLEEDGFGKHPYYYFLVAEINQKIIGLSFYWIRYSTWKGKFLYLEDFVIKKEYRRKGIGSKLFEATIKISQKHECHGMIWQVLDWNTSAINFYKKYNANISGEWLNGKLTKQQIKKIIRC